MSVFGSPIVHVVLLGFANPSPQKRMPPSDESIACVSPFERFTSHQTGALPSNAEAGTTAIASGPAARASHGGPCFGSIVRSVDPPSSMALVLSTATFEDRFADAA